MTTSKQMRAEGERLQADLAQIKADLSTANHDLQRAAGRGADDEAQALAQKVTILQARQRGVEDAIKQNAGELAAREKFLHSADYRSAQEKMGELEDLFEREAAAIFADLQAIGKRLEADAEKREEYKRLLRSYGVESERPEARLHSRELDYLQQIEKLLGKQHEADQFRSNVAARNTPAARERERQADEAARQQRARNLNALRQEARQRGVKANYDAGTYSD